MCLLLETIALVDGRWPLLHHHQARCTNSRRLLLGASDELLLRRYLPDGSAYPGTWKCRVMYDVAVRSVELMPYKPRQIKRLRLVAADRLMYDHKYADRSMFDGLMAEHADVDDLILVKDGCIADTTYANLVFFDGKRWYTPRQPLLHGVRRASLLAEGTLTEANITPADLWRFSKVALINAMMPLGTCLVDLPDGLADP